ncbi:glutathione S-transferase family protein [Shewanella dokdonensis]|uniref:Glutathione S-transferase n=1 Tax=Shewanella dokdonensis TaxID=712036 RepID=A0ABX8DF09_9GAMM|nr:glutathione S-transferase [Shewanella dokdonensis]MCL1076082.1 glutathione S-transferase [Shewanella dokdonensis]QVK23188.1 glutathione S-transferase [Shewanella dokdonensis]
MKLIGMLDSPFVRRVAVSLQLLGLKFEHQPLSVFSTFEAFAQINPVVKAPTLICDDGTALMDSTLILQYAAALAPSRKLLADDPKILRQQLQLLGLALAACEKSVQLVYERQLRPQDKQFDAWAQRVTSQLLAAFEELEQQLAAAHISLTSDNIDQANITIAIAWYFSQQMLPEVVIASDFPQLVALSAQAECLPEFQCAPFGSSACQFTVER